MSAQRIAELAQEFYDATLTLREAEQTELHYQATAVIGNTVLLRSDRLTKIATEVLSQQNFRQLVLERAQALAQKAKVALEDAVRENEFASP